MTPAQFYQIEQGNQQYQQEQKQQSQQALMKGVMDLGAAYIGQQAQKAQTKAFGNILETHGETIFGEGAGDLLDRYKKGSQQDQLAMMNFMGGQFGQQLGRAEYLNQQAAAFGGRGGAGGGNGGGAFFTMPGQ